MTAHCPNCNYDLAGLRDSDITRCPECGTECSPETIATGWERRISRRWLWFYVSPLLGLPGVVAYFVGYPILSVTLGTIFALRAMALDEQHRNSPSSALSRGINAFVLSVSWTVLAGLALAALSVALMTVSNW